jgi:hypothetical protein
MSVWGSVMHLKRIAYFGVAILLGNLAFGLTARASVDVHGHVYAADTLQPLANATVQLFLNCTTGFFGVICDFESSVISADDGSYDLASVEAGDGDVTAFFDTGTTANYLRVSQSISVDDNSSIEQDLYMNPGGTIAGQVTRASDGSPLPNVQIQLLEASDRSVDRYAATDSSGNFEFIRLDAGGYIVATEQAAPYLDQYFSGHASTPPSQGLQLADTITLDNGQVDNAVDFSLVPGSVIEGAITDSLTGLPFQKGLDVTVGVYDANDLSGSPWLNLGAVVGANGQYMINGLPSVPIRLGAYIENPYYDFTFLGCGSNPCEDISDAAIFAPSTVAPLTVDFSMFPGSVATGTVVRRSDGKPMSDVVVEAFSDPPILGHLTLATATTDAEGRYTLTNISNSNFFVDTLNVHVDGVSYIDQVYDNQDCPQANCLNIGDMISASTGSVVPNVNFALDAGGAISGEIIRGDTGLGIIAGLSLYASDGSVSDRFASNADGTFETTGLPPGIYYLSATISAPYAGCLVYPNGLCYTDPTTAGQPIVISGANSVTGITITFPADELFKGTFE